jgi:hypothetical protein
MSEPKAPESRPEPPETPAAEPPVYGGRWGGSGKQGDQPGEGQVDRPHRVSDPAESEGQGDTDPASGGSPPS